MLKKITEEMSDWWDWNGEIVIAVLVIVAIGAGIIYGDMTLSEARCIAKTENMGFAHRWSSFGGCQIEVVEGQWIPLENYYFKQE